MRYNRSSQLKIADVKDNAYKHIGIKQNYLNQQNMEQFGKKRWKLNMCWAVQAKWNARIRLNLLENTVVNNEVKRDCRGILGQPHFCS